MKKITLYFLTFAFSASINAQLNWSNEVSVADGSVYGSEWPRIEIVDGKPIVLWGNISNGAVYTAKWNGNSFDAPVLITPPGIAAFVASWAGPDFATGNSEVYVVFEEDPLSTSSVYLRKSADAGISYSDTVLAVVIPSGFSRFPSVAIGDSGRVYVMSMEHQTGSGPIWSTAISTDGGQSFSGQTPTGTTVPGSEVCDCCPGKMVANDSISAAVFRNNNNNLRDHWLVTSYDNGATYGNEVDIDNTDWNIMSCPSSGPDAILDGNNLISVFYSGGNGSPRVYASQANVSTGALITNTLLVANPVPSNANMNFTRISGNSDTLGIVWEQNRFGSIRPVFTYSTSGVTGLMVEYDTISISQTTNSRRKPDVVYHNRTFYFVYQDYETGDIRFRFASFDPITAIEEMHTGSFHLFPNPAENYLTIQHTFDGQLSLRVLDLTGRTVKSKYPVNKTSELDISNLSSGMYYMVLENSGTVAVSKKFLVK